MLTVKKNLVYLVNYRDRSSMVVDEASNLDSALKEKRRRARYMEHIDDVVTNQMRQVISALLTLSKPDD